MQSPAGPGVPRQGGGGGLAFTPPAAAKAVFDPALVFSEQTLADLAAPELWRALVPFLSVSVACRDGPMPMAHPNAASRPIANPALLSEALLDDGFFKLSPGAMDLPTGLCQRLACAVRILREHGYPATFLAVYDEAWQVAEVAARVVASATGGSNVPLGDWFVFEVDSGNGRRGYRPGAPHRDRPLAGSSSFGPNSLPLYCSVWVALSDATPQNSCLYFLSKRYDVGYSLANGGDAVREAVQSPAQWNDFEAQPLPTGGMLTFSHRLLHWASNPQRPSPLDDANACQSRIALTFAFADPSFESAYFDQELYSTLPPLELRIGLCAGQMIQYSHMHAIDKHTLALYQRLFHAHKAFFATWYADKITSKVQFMKFQRQNPNFVAADER